MSDSTQKQMPAEIWAYLFTGNEQEGSFRTYDASRMFDCTKYTRSDQLEAKLAEESEASRHDIERLMKANAELLAENEAMGEKLDVYEAALTSISKNTCCDRCQEAALVARAALEGDGKDQGNDNK